MVVFYIMYRKWNLFLYCLKIICDSEKKSTPVSGLHFLSICQYCITIWMFENVMLQKELKLLGYSVEGKTHSFEWLLNIFFASKVMTSYGCNWLVLQYTQWSIAFMWWLVRSRSKTGKAWTEGYDISLMTYQ